MLLHIVAAYSLLSSALRARLSDSDVYDTTGNNTWIAHLVRARFWCELPSWAIATFTCCYSKSRSDEINGRVGKVGPNKPIKARHFFRRAHALRFLP
jgi:hypothetical protein